MECSQRLSAFCLCCRTLLDVPEVCKDLWAFFQSHVKGRVIGDSARIVLIDSASLQ